MHKVYLKGLDCAVCAAKVEKHVKGHKAVRSARVDFATSTLHVDTDNINDVLKVIMQADSDIVPFVIRSSEERRKLLQKKSSIVKEVILFGIAIVLGIVALLITNTSIVSISLFGLEASVIKEIIVFVLYFLSWGFAGHNVIESAIKNVLKLDFLDENFLMMIATIGAFAIGDSLEAASVMLFFKLGETLQDFAVNHSRSSIDALMNLKPDTVRILENGSEKIIPSDDAVKGVLFRVYPGERVALDGIIEAGEALLDKQAITGESMPVAVKIGDEVLSGTIVTNSSLDIRAIRPALESSAARIVELVEHAQSSKAKSEKFITQFARYYTPVVIALAIIAALVPFIFFGESFPESFKRALVMLVISCPCALVVSVPLAYFGAIGASARHGILVKGAKVFDALNSIDTVVFDKTGTLTNGTFSIKGIQLAPNVNKDEVLQYAYIVESKSNHPLAKAVVLEAEKNKLTKDININDISNVLEIAGKGVSCTFKGDALSVGNSAFMKDLHIDLLQVESKYTLIYVVKNGVCLGILELGDTIREESAETVKGLKALGINHFSILSGDRQLEVETIAKEAGIEDIHAELLPEDKVKEFEKIIANGKKAAFVGDGINDAPVLARSHAGIAMGLRGQDLAVETADLVLMTDNPLQIVKAVKIARKTRSLVWQNIIFALVVKCVFLAAGGFGLANMWEALFADVGVALLAVLNSSRSLNS